MANEIQWHETIDGIAVKDLFLEKSKLIERTYNDDWKAKQLLDVFNMHVNKKTSIEIGDKLNISPDTVNKRIAELKDIYDKTQKHNTFLPERHPSEKNKKRNKRTRVKYDDFSSTIDFELSDGRRGIIDFKNMIFNSSEECFYYVADTISKLVEKNFYELKNTKISIKNIEFTLNKE